MLKVFSKSSEWTPVNISKNASQGHAVESNFGCEDFGGWKDLSAQPWLYQLYTSEKTKGGKLDPRLYWTIGTHETDWEGFEYGNVAYKKPMTNESPIVTIKANGGLPMVCLLLSGPICVPVFMRLSLLV